MIRTPLTALLLMAVPGTGTTQTVTYAPPELGPYTCGSSGLSVTIQPGGGATYGVQTVPSVFGSLTLRAGGRYTLSNGGGGTYAARPSGEIRFTGTMGGSGVQSVYEAKNGRFVISFQFRSAQGKVARLDCSRVSAAARMAVEGPVNGPLPGTLTLRAYPGDQYVAVQAASGQATPLPPTWRDVFRARTGEAIFETGSDVVVASLDGTERARLKEDIYQETMVDLREDFTLSPGGQRYAYGIRLPGDLGGYSVLVRDRAGRLLAQLAGYQTPDFLPDGRLLLGGLPDGQPGLFLTDRAYANPRRIDPGLRFPFTPAASPDGRLVAFVDGGTGKLHVIRPDGTGLRTVPTADARALGFPVWSPDGKWIAVLVELDGAPYTAEIMVVPASGAATPPVVLRGPDLERVRTPTQPLSRLSWR